MTISDDSDGIFNIDMVCKISSHIVTIVTGNNQEGTCDEKYTDTGIVIL